jgi:hypothetical protein
MVDIGLLFGSGSTASAGGTIPALASFKLSQKNGVTKELEKFSKQQNIQKDIAYFKAKIATVKTAEEITKDPRLLKVITSAFELDEDLKYPAKIKEVINSDLKDQRSYANRLIDPRYKKMAEAFKLKEFGTFYLKQGMFQNDVANRYVRNEYEKSLATTNPALREAAYFMRNIGNVTDTYQILGDKVLRAIVTSTLGLPDVIANQSVDKQRQLIEAKLDIKKFRPAGAGDTTATAKTPVQTANDELTKLISTRSAVTSAQTSVTEIINRIQSINDSYARLANIQNPAGYYATEIPVQQAAAPELVRQKGLIGAAQNALGDISTSMTRMNQLIQAVGDPANAADLADYKIEFDALRTRVADAVAGATYSYDDGTSGANFTAQNLIDGSMGGAILEVQYKSTGEKTSVRSLDMSAASAFQTQLDAANAAFQAISGSTDSANIAAASGALTTSRTDANFATLTVAVDANVFTENMASVPQWATTLDTAQLYPGAEAVRDAGARLTQLNQLMIEVRLIAQESAALDPSADRTLLTARYADVVDGITQLIGNADNPSVANLLSGADQSYQLTTDTYVKARGRDLSTSISAILAAGDITTQGGASAIIGQLDTGIKTAVEDATREIAVDSQFFSFAADTLDPRAKVDSEYRKLATDVPGLITKAKSGTTNLLDSLQESITVALTSITQSLKISPATTFGSAVRDLLNAGSQLLPTDGADTSGALAKLEEVRFNAARILGDLNSSGRLLDNSRATMQQKITDLEKAAGPGLTGPNVTAFARQFIEKYLAKKDAEAAASGITGGSNSYVLQLIQPIGVKINTSA